MNNRPRINLSWQRLDYLMEFAGWFLLTATFFITIYFYPKLPDIIPSHFNALGEPDGWSGKRTLWISPIIAAVLFASIRLLTNYPHVLNYLTEITEHNAEYQYRLATRLLRSLNVVMTGVFFYIQLSIAQAATGKWEGTGTWFIFSFLGLMTALVVLYLLRSSKGKST